MLRRTVLVAGALLFFSACVPPPQPPAQPSPQAPTPAPPPPAPTPSPAEPEAPSRTPDVIYVPTPPEVVDAMLAMAQVTEKDVVYDLGCGDGRIPVAAAQKYGARAVGIDIDPVRIGEAKANVRNAGVDDKVTIIQGDLFTTDISEATVVTLYLLPSLNLKLLPKLKSELKPGTRIVSHSFDMGDEWPPEKKQQVDGRMIYMWTVGKS